MIGAPLRKLNPQRKDQNPGKFFYFCIFEHILIIMENPFQAEQQKFFRPTFLTVLCILTFIGSGWSILSDLFRLFLSGTNNSVEIHQYTSMVEKISGQESSPFMAGFMNTMMDFIRLVTSHAREMAVIDLVLSLISLLGAILMFQLRRFGFYFYTTAQILMIFILPYFAGFTPIVIFSMAFPAIVTIAFIVMYGVNIKYLK